MASTVRYLHHPASQPCRAVQQFMLEAEIPFEEEIVDIMSGINEKQDFKDEYNPTGQVPILVDGDFKVWESAAIAYYLNDKFDVADNWFGGAPEQRGRIQQYLHWHSTTLRRGAGAFFYSNFAECIWNLIVEHGCTQFIKVFSHDNFSLKSKLDRSEHLVHDDKESVVSDNFLGQYSVH